MVATRTAFVALLLAGLAGVGFNVLFVAASSVSANSVTLSPLNALGLLVFFLSQYGLVLAIAVGGLIVLRRPSQTRLWCAAAASSLFALSQVESWLDLLQIWMRTLKIYPDAGVGFRVFLLLTEFNSFLFAPLAAIGGLGCAAIAFRRRLGVQ